MSNNNKAFEFAEKIPFEDLFDEIRKATGIQELKFVKRIDEDRYGMPRIKFESQDLADRVGFLQLLFREIKIATFNTEIVLDKETNEYKYWGTAAFDYSHPAGGSNGHTFMTFWYDERKGWEFQLDSERS